MSDIRDALEESALELGLDLPELPESETEEEETTDLNTPQPEEQEAQPTEPVSEVSPHTSSEDIAPPASWKTEMRKHWGSLPSDVRNYISEREKQQHAYISRFGNEHAHIKRELTDIESVFKPFEEAIKASGATKKQVIEQLITERSEMMRDPKSFIKRLADAQKIDLLDIAVDSDLKDPPEVRQARWQVEDEKRRLEAERNELQRIQQESQVSQLTSFIEDWGATKPHFQQARQAMAQVLPEVQATYPYLSFPEQLEATYEAVMRHPSFSSLNRPQPVTPAVKKASSGISGVTGIPTQPQEAGSIREALIQAAKETGYI